MSDDPFDRPDPPGADIPADEEGAYPWDDQVPDDPDALSAGALGEEGPRQRHDAFTEARKSVFLKALVKTGCILDACRKTGISPRTVYRHQGGDPAFFEHCRIALSMSGAPVELTAWKRAVEGVDEEVVVGGKVQVRRRYSESLLRLLLQGSNPKKYGPRPGFKRKRILKVERKQMEREVRAEIKAAKAQAPSIEEVTASILRKIEAIQRHNEPKKLAAGWTKSADGHWIPPGYAPIPGYVAPSLGASGEDGTPLDSM